MAKSTLIAGLLCSLMVVGCSTTPIDPKTAEQIPQARVYLPAMTTRVDQAHSAGVTFVRDSGFSGGGCSHDVFVNNAKVFSIRPGESIQLWLEPGPYFFRLETGGGLCPNIATSQNTILSKDEHQTYRILLPSDGGLRLTRTE